MQHDFSHIDVNEQEELHGPLFKYSEYKVGQHITYSIGDEVHTGEILWISAPGDVAGTHVPMSLIVNRDMPGGVVSFPDIVYRTDVLDDNGQEL